MLGLDKFLGEWLLWFCFLYFLFCSWNRYYCLFIILVVGFCLLIIEVCFLEVCVFLFLLVNVCVLVKGFELVLWYWIMACYCFLLLVLFDWWGLVCFLIWKVCGSWCIFGLWWVVWWGCRLVFFWCFLLFGVLLVFWKGNWYCGLLYC